MLSTSLEAFAETLSSFKSAIPMDVSYSRRIASKPKGWLCCGWTRLGQSFEVRWFERSCGRRRLDSVSMSLWALFGEEIG